MKISQKLSLLTAIGMSFSVCAIAQQEPLKPSYEKRALEKDGKYYVQKSLPIYLKFSTTPDGKEYPLKSAEHPSDANPLYFDSEGVNYVRSKWAVDPSTKKMINPPREVMMEMYADGYAPVTILKFDGAPRHVASGTTYFGKGLNFSLSAKDEISGVMETQYALNGSYTKYLNTVSAINEGANTLYYYSADFVGNAEETKSHSFIVDLTPPVSSHEIKGIVYNNNILAPSTTFKLTTNDNLSGVNSVLFTFDHENNKAYAPNISISQLSDGEHTLHYFAIDNVKNESEKASFNFYLDKTAPVVKSTVIGDQYKSSTHFYVSTRTKINLAATDNKSGVKQIYYRTDGAKNHTDYSSDFAFPTAMGLHTVEYDAEDNVNNLCENKSLTVFMDNRAPETGIFYGTPQFFTRDTLFITSQTPVTLKANDGQSGIKTVSYAIDGGSLKQYEKFTISGAGSHRVTFKSIDNVNNEEDIKGSTVIVDNTPPELFVNFSIEPIGKKGNLNIYPNYVRMYIAATDKQVGAEKLQYSIDGGPLVDYSSAQTLDISELSQFKEKKEYKVRVVGEDKLGNKAEKTFQFFVGRNSN